MNIKALKQRLATMSAFLTLEFRGKEDCLMEGKTPLSVECTPPSSSWLLESGQLTSVILRYSESYQKVSKNGENLTEALRGKPEIAQDVMKEVAEKILSSEEDKVKQIATIVKLAKDYLIHKAAFGYYGDMADKIALHFVADKYEADLRNEESSDDKIFIWVDTVDDMELVATATEIMRVMPEGNVVPAIPIKDETIQLDGKIEEGVTGSVPADKVATFPRNTRSIIVEDVS